MGAVAEVVLGRAPAFELVAVGIEAAGRRDDVGGQVLVGEIDPGVDDADPDALTGRPGPGGRSADHVDPPLLIGERVVAGVGRGCQGGDEREPGEHGYGASPKETDHRWPPGKRSFAWFNLPGSYPGAPAGKP